MVKFWQVIRGKPMGTREQSHSIQVREVAEAKRQELERAMGYRRHEISDLVEGVIPKRGAEQ